MGNKLKEMFMPWLKWQDTSIIDANPCETCPIHQEYMEKALYGSVAERQYAEPPDTCPCIKKLTWEGECLAKLEWYESQDRRLHPELEKPQRIIVMPCEIGDPVYDLVGVKGQMPFIREGTMAGIHISDRNHRRVRKYKDYLIVRCGCGELTHLDMDKIGKTIFFSEEEAKKAREQHHG